MRLSLKHIYYRWVAKGFTGQITDARGRKRYYVDGKPVAREKYEGAGHQHKEDQSSQAESVKHVIAAIVKPNPGTKDLQSLAEHLNNVPTATLRKIQARYGVQGAKNPVKEKLVSALLDHVRGGGPAVHAGKYREAFGVHPDKELLASKEGREKLNSHLERHAKGEDVIDEVRGKKGGEVEQVAVLNPKDAESADYASPLPSEAETGKPWEGVVMRGRQVPKKGRQAVKQTDAGDYGKGVYWSGDGDRAAAYARPVIGTRGDEGLVHVERVRLNNPLVFQTAEEAAKWRGQFANEGRLNPQDEEPAIRAHLAIMEGGYDGVVVYDTSGSMTSRPNKPFEVVKLGEIDSKLLKQYPDLARKYESLKNSQTAVHSDANNAIDRPKQESVRKPVGNRTETYEFTREEWIGDGWGDEAERVGKDHRSAVESALSQGKPVPPEVLADYPDLAEKYGDKPTADTAPTPSPAQHPLDAIEPGKSADIDGVQVSRGKLDPEMYTAVVDGKRRVDTREGMEQFLGSRGPKPPEPGFTGVAANGVRYVNGVPQKSIEDALQGKPVADIHDFGEKLEGARKYTATKREPKGKVQPVEESEKSPRWAKGYHVYLDSKSGKWHLDQEVKGPFKGLTRTVGKYDSKEEAESSIARIAAGSSHGIRKITGQDGKDEFAIARRVPNKNPIIKSGFKTYEEAAKYLYDNPAEFLNHRFTNWEDHSYLAEVKRDGPSVRKGDVTTDQFQKAFGFRSGEFGNWQTGSNRKDGQEALNHAYDALHDLADAIGLPTKDISLRGDLAIAFGSRGSGGIRAAKAHYEPRQRVINLTKMKGAGSLAHEWFHALDHHVARLEHGLNTESLLSSKMPYKANNQELVEAWKGFVDSMKYKTQSKIPDVSSHDKAIARNRSTTAEYLAEVEESLQYRAKKSKDGSKKEMTAEQKVRWEQLKQDILNGDIGGYVPGSSQFESRFAKLDEMNQIYKSVTGTSFYTSDPRSLGSKLALNNSNYKSFLKDIEKAKAGEANTTRVKTDFVKNASKLDDKRSGDYYSLTHEMAARAFSAYVEDKLKEKNRKSDYLSARSENWYYTLTDDKPFPEGEERVTINQSLDKLFGAVKKHFSS